MCQFPLVPVPSAQALRFWKESQLKAYWPLHKQGKWGNRKSCNSDVPRSKFWIDSLAWLRVILLPYLYNTTLNDN